MNSSEVLTNESLMHRMRKVSITLATLLASVELYMFDEELEEVSISQLLDLEEFQWYENPTKAINHMLKHGFLQVTRNERTQDFPRGYRNFSLTPRGRQIADDYRELQLLTAVAYRRRVGATA